MEDSSEFKHEGGEKENSEKKPQEQPKHQDSKPQVPAPGVGPSGNMTGTSIVDCNLSI